MANKAGVFRATNKSSREDAGPQMRQLSEATVLSVDRAGSMATGPWVASFNLNETS